MAGRFRSPISSNTTTHITDMHKKLSETIVELLASGEPFTDIHIESNMQVMLRQSAYKWVPAMHQDQPILVSHEQIKEFLNGVFAGSEDSAKRKDAMQWRINLNAQGSLHPALNLSTLIDNVPKTFRVRCTVQKQMMGEAIGIMIRPLPEVPGSIEKVGLPYQVERLLKSAYRGMIIVTGPTGAGKSTSLAAMLSELNDTRDGNILTIEDPVEFVHDRKRCIINQREVGIDVNSFADGVRDSQRFVPDMMMIGEIRDADTMKAAVRAAESGQLVLTSMHAPTTFAAIRKMLAYLSDSQADMQTLPYLLLGVVAQALVRDKSGSGRNYLASEFLDCRDPRVVQAIVECGASDGSQQKLAALEKQLLAGELGTIGLPMLAALKEMVEKNQVDAQSAAAAVTTSEEKKQLMQLGQR